MRKKMENIKVEEWFVWLILYSLICTIFENVFLRILLLSFYWGALLFSFHKKNKWTACGMCKPAEEITGWDFLILLPLLILPIVNLFIYRTNEYVAEEILWTVYVAFGEEFLFRGFLLSIFTRQYKQGILKGAILNSGIFACMHVTNIFVGYDWKFVGVQIIYAASVGFGLAIITCWKKSLIPAIAVHLLINVTAQSDLYEKKIIFWLCFGLLYFIYAGELYVRRRKMQGEIVR